MPPTIINKEGITLQKTKIIALYFLISAVALCVALWSLMWMFSSASLASGHCGEFSLFHEAFRCRQPYIAVIILSLSSFVAVVSLIVAIIKWRKK